MIGTHIPDLNTRVAVERGFVYVVRARVTTMSARHRTTDTTALLKNRGRRAFPIDGGDAKITLTYIVTVLCKTELDRFISPCNHIITFYIVSFFFLKYYYYYYKLHYLF